MRIVSNGVQPYIVQTGVDTDGETQEEVTTFRMKLDVSEWKEEADNAMQSPSGLPRHENQRALPVTPPPSAARSSCDTI
ncbi:hypothetical protein DPX16_18529 [Anabarilius grahami]|uniref:Uncharacterized protein n=1 Tax=Anabarilius grahami TaxID=495550 RepID=A0A3N0YYP6_ANAGA|nr:hypothetical protein DPX16_18529 [Anabarilius grahami]